MTFSRPPFFRRKLPEIPKESLSKQLERAMVAGAKRILFVDDDSAFREMVGHAASSYNVELVDAETSGQAKQLLEEGGFDAAILDVRVTNGDGIELYRWMMDRFPRVTVIFLTGMEIEAVSEKIHAVGSAPVYFKPTLLSTAFIEDLLNKLGARPRQSC